MSGYNDAWRKIFSEENILHRIDRSGTATLLASRMKAITGEEPRLLAKMDASANRPDVFQDANLALCPVNNGEYVIYRDPQLRSYWKAKHVLGNLAPVEYHSDPAFNQ